MTDPAWYRVTPETDRLLAEARAELATAEDVAGLRQELTEARAALAEHDRRWQQRADLVTHTSELRRRTDELTSEVEAFEVRVSAAEAALARVRSVGAVFGGSDYNDGWNDALKAVWDAADVPSDGPAVRGGTNA